MNWAELAESDLSRVLGWAENQPWAQAMADCQQDEEWHAEGDVWTHTVMVCNELCRLEGWESLGSERQLILIFTALFHDAAKPVI